MHQLLEQALVVWILRVAIPLNLQKVFNKAEYSNCYEILNCAEAVIEQSKSLHSQACAWSDYKHHNTVKLLTGISLNGFITFSLDCFFERDSDKYITEDSCFYDISERSNQVMADRYFQIKKGLLLHFCSFAVPSSPWMKSQMVFAEIWEYKDVVNLHIHVEHAINRI